MNRHTARGALAAILLCAAGTLAAQNYPAGPVRFLVPFPPGGGIDTMGRLFGSRLSEAIGKPVIVENRAGANGMIGSRFVARAPKDGYMLLINGVNFVTTPSLFKNAEYDPLKDFDPVSLLALAPNILVVHPSLPVKNVREFIALAKAKPGVLNFATSSTGGPTHIPAELFNIVAGTKMQQIPYKGGGPAMTDVLGGQVQVVFAIPSNVVGHVKSGKLRALAVTGEKRLAALPQVPTAIESGLKGFDGQNWYGILAPAGKPCRWSTKCPARSQRFLPSPMSAKNFRARGWTLTI